MRSRISAISILFSTALAPLAVLALQVFYYKWRPSDIMINVLVSLAIWYIVFLAVVWLITQGIALFRRTPSP